MILNVIPGFKIYGVDLFEVFLQTVEKLVDKSWLLQHQGVIVTFHFISIIIYIFALRYLQVPP